MSATPSSSTSTLPTFEVDKTGLSKLLERRGKEFVLGELFQNAVDQNVTRVDMTLQLIGGGLAELRVEDDDPEGFSDLAHAYTLFAESGKKGDPTKRGRFNLGEKLVIALCKEARIVTTKGEVRFTEAGREMLDSKRKRGSKFEGVFPMSDAEYDRALRFVHTLLVPEGVVVTFNGEQLPERPPLRVFEGSLRTEKADGEGVLRPTTRKGTIRVFAVRDGETAHLYEMGIPVVETGDKYHVDIGQKVPINLDRDNVQPSYLRDVRRLVLNNTYDLIEGEEDGAGTWIDNALEDSDIAPEAVQAVVRARYGDKVVVADPTDREAEKIAVSKGYTVVKGGAFSGQAWKQVKASEALQPAGQVTPSPDPYGKDGADLMLMEYDHAPLAVRRLVDFTVALAAEVLDAAITVKLANNPQWPFAATYGPRKRKTEGEFTYNIGSLGFAFFDTDKSPERADRALALIVHEFAHHDASDHLSKQFYDACCKVAARIARVMADKPEYADWLYRGVAPAVEAVAA